MTIEEMVRTLENLGYIVKKKRPEPIYMDLYKGIKKYLEDYAKMNDIKLTEYRSKRNGAKYHEESLARHEVKKELYSAYKYRNWSDIPDKEWPEIEEYLYYYAQTYIRMTY